MEIREVTTFSTDVAEAVRNLLPALSSSADAPSDQLIAAIINGDSTHLFVASDAGAIVGMLTLAIFPIPSGMRAWIEDVVVSEGGRGKGVGEALNRAAMDKAKLAGARTVDLTSRPSREAANRLYQRIGFVRRDTHVYRFDVHTD